MRTPDRGDVRGMARCSEPVVNRGADAAALDRRIAGAMVASDQQHEAVAARDGGLEGSVDRSPGGIEAHPMQIEHAVRLDRAAPKPLVPAAVQRFLGDRHGTGARRVAVRGCYLSLADLDRLRRFSSPVR